MTVQEAIQLMKHRIETASDLVGKGADGKAFEDMEIAIECMKEVEQYRALEEKLNGISVEHIVNAFIERVEKDTNEGYEKGRILTNAEADMWEQYRALGTVEELKEAREKQIPKKPITYKDTNRADCPICGNTVRGIKEPFGDYCSKCGNKVDWSEEDD